MAQNRIPDMISRGIAKLAVLSVERRHSLDRHPTYTVAAGLAED